MILAEPDPNFAPSFWLLPASRRPHLQAIVRFVQLTHTVTPALPYTAIVARLRTLADALDRPVGGLEAGAMAAMAEVRRTLAETGASPRHLRHLLEAREREAGGWRPDTWSDVLVHCQFVAAPLGRLLLEICSEDQRCSGRVIDALSGAVWMLHALHHLDGKGPDFPPLCIPRRFLEDAMINDQLSPAGGARGQVRAVLDRVLDGVDRMLLEARLAPRLVAMPGLRWHTATTLCRAGKLATKLRHRDPFHLPVQLCALQRWSCLGMGLMHRVFIRTP